MRHIESQIQKDCVTCAEKEAKERMRAKAHHIIEKMMAGIF